MKRSAFPDFRASTFDDRKLYLSVILMIVLFKIAVLLIWGPGIAPDTGGYTRFAELILESSDWLTDAGLEDSAMPTTVFRIAGYPMFIALTQLISSENWQWIVVLSQFLLSAVSLYSLSRLISALGMKPFLGAFSLLATGLSLSLLLDNMILTDSFATSLFVIVLSENAVATLRGRPFGFVQALLFGMLITLAFLVREGVAILSILFVMPFLVRAFVAEKKTWRSCAAIAVFFIPLVLSSQIYMSWNEGRTGYRFVTSGGQTVYLQGLFDAAEKDQRIFSGNEPIEIAARDYAKDYAFSEVLSVQASLFNNGYVAPELANMSKQKYFESWLEYPGSMLRMTIGHIRENYAMLPFRPFDAVRQTGFWIEGVKPWPDYRELRKDMFNDVDLLVLFVGEMVERAIAVIITIAFVVVPIIWFVRLCRGRTERYREILVCLALWAFYFGVLIAHAMVHLETRYLAAVLPFSTLIGCLCLQRMVRDWRFSKAKS
ncbi:MULTISPECIES: hypothetical protein [unclassified Thalassospira]|uniref:hypothetical protein n=1 Tax=unclassified Thalassospira TaxID=2648997 RepID=UPI0007A64197|nr:MULTISPECIES: hypothetical protein [unclassified Thalassospira]KZD00152.1 hypothetical protein AUQ41_06020 [Thalassospira sp. MCCC 1A02898]ONH87332.1 hypothetical protein TH47_13720 [Thalassospira sp. MCCC 1A02803]